MPDVDGLTLLQAYRANDATATTPVIVLSGNDDPATRARALALGADDYVVKLPAKEALIACLRRHAGAAPGSNETLDRSILAALESAGGPAGSGFARALIDQFLREAASQIQGMKHAAERADARALEATAHNLRGSAMTMGANKLAALCARIERDAASTIQGLDAGVPLGDLDREFSRVQEALAPEQPGADRS